MKYYDEYMNWLNNEYFDAETRSELEKIHSNLREIEDRFYKELDFGTGGMRGIMGAGTNRMNIYTVRKVTQGLSDYIANQGEAAKVRGVVIAYDSRHKSPEFAVEAARVFCGNGITVYLFDELRPTPELSFAVRLLHSAAGVVITASHNPKEYNGYKVYTEDGSQMSPSMADEVLTETKKISDLTQVKLSSVQAALEKGLLKTIGRELDDEYIAKLKELSLSGKIVEKFSTSLKIVYTPLHGTGNKPVRRILSECGFKNVLVVKSQEYPDGEFTNARPCPNPEEKRIFRHAVRLAKKQNADLILATDPDCDRLGVMVKTSKSRYMLLSGNQTGAILTEYYLSRKEEISQLPGNAFIAKTIVTTGLVKAAADYYGVETVEVLTGFKYIGEKIREMDDLGGRKFLLGIEDSCGYLAGTFVRDKDGVLASMLVAEAAAYYEQFGMTLYEVLQLLYRKYGYFAGDMCCFTLRGKEGLENIKAAMRTIRDSSHSVFADVKIEAIRDYLSGRRYDLKTYREDALTLPKSDVLYYEVSGGSWFCIRPSGTEPKIKIYFEAHAKDKLSAETELRHMKKYVLAEMRKILRKGLPV